MGDEPGMKAEQLVQEIIQSLESTKAEDLISMEVGEKSSLTDFLVIATGTSSTHLKGMADKVHFDLKKQGQQPLGVEGVTQGDWLLMDYNEVIVHLFTPQRREEIQIEDLFETERVHRDGN